MTINEKESSVNEQNQGVHSVSGNFSVRFCCQAPDNDSSFSLYGVQNKALPQNLLQYPTTCRQKAFLRGKFVAVNAKGGLWCTNEVVRRLLTCSDGLKLW